MTTASKNQARDLEVDLVICEAATPGPYTIEPCRCHSVCKYVFIRKITHSDGRLLPEDARFIAEARKGWPYAIRRALEAEAEVDRLRAENAMLLEALNQRGCGL